MAATPILKLNNIAFSFPDGRTILKGLDFQLFKGDRIGLTGPNGSGKTTLFHILVGLLKPETGTLEAFGRTLEKEKDFVSARKKVGLLFQDADDQLFCPTVLEDVAFGPLNLGRSPEEARTIAQRTLTLLGLQGFEQRVTHRLSGGEKKLVSLATLLAMEPEVLLLDEPTNGLDEKTRSNFLDILTNLDITYVVISHDFDFLARSTRSIFALVDGRIHTEQKVAVHQHIHAHVQGAFPHEHE